MTPSVMRRPAAGSAPRVVAVVQARLSSRRLPGKILKLLAGRPSLDYLLEALGQCRSLAEVVIATSVDPSDEPTAAFAAGRGLCCHRGPLDDVALRLLDAARSVDADAFVRVNGDSPLLDPALIDEAVELYLRTAADLVSNVHPRSFPKGQSVEVISVEAMRRAVDAMTTPQEREHVTPYFYAHDDEFVIRSFGATQPRPDVQLSIDSPEDFTRCEAILAELGVPPWQAGWQACVRAYDRVAAAGGGAA